MNMETAAKQVYLHSYLEPFAALLARREVTDIYVNRAGEIWSETLGGAIERHDAPALNEVALARLARQLAALSHQGISREHPLLSGTLPDGTRVQIAAPPATRKGHALALRKHVAAGIRLADYDTAGAFGAVHTGPDRRSELAGALRDMADLGQMAKLLTTAVQARCNIIVSGGTATGKTTFLNALLAEIPLEERLILIEDTPELQVENPNMVGMIAARSALGEAAITADDLLGASLRMRPDRIIVGELRGPEAYTFLRAINSGHPGSMTTVHANHPDGALDQIALLVMQTGTLLSRSDIRDYVDATVDVFVQLKRQGARRYVDEIRFGAPCR